jgi:hypothetical protein
MNTELPKLTASKLITALTYIIPGLLVFEIIYEHGYFTHLPGPFPLSALLLHLLWSVALSIPFHFFRWLFLRPAKHAAAMYVPGIRALFVLILLVVFYIFAGLFEDGYIRFGIGREELDARMGASFILTAIAAFPLGIVYPKLASVIVSWRDRKAGEGA